MTEKPRFKPAFDVHNQSTYGLRLDVQDADKVMCELHRCYELLAEAERMAEKYANRDSRKVQGEFTGDYDVDVGPLYYSHWEDIDPGVEPAREFLEKLSK